ncbi:hypothetical protein AVEN_54716-1 [Araneus ventricosus]|uniref:Uncharacterized protein n=1 Tax=Araneus ventricosus TaxID=182803 RepID=A0A4Y2HCL3_ARAVE|nr:hypothetical protein AVEN_54716-1 [Araneus ventricosus]
MGAIDQEPQSEFAVAWPQSFMFTRMLAGRVMFRGLIKMHLNQTEIFIPNLIYVLSIIVKLNLPKQSPYTASVYVPCEPDQSAKMILNNSEFTMVTLDFDHPTS